MDQTTVSKAWHYALKIFLVIGTLFYIPINQGFTAEEAAIQGYMMQEMFFRYGVIALYIFAMPLKARRTFCIKSVILFFLFVFLTSLAGGFSVYLRAKLLNVFFAVMFLKLVFEHLNYNEISGIAKWFGWICFGNVAMMALQIYGLDPLLSQSGVIQEDRLDMVVGFMRLKVHVGVLAALLAPLMLAHAKFFLPLLIPMLYFSESSAAVVAVAVAFLVYFYHTMPKKWFYAVVSGLFIASACYVIFYDMPGGQFAERLKVWHATISLSLKSNPWIGNGIGSFAKMNLNTIQGNNTLIGWTWAHNEFVQAFYEFGIVGLVMIFAFLHKHLKDLKYFDRDKSTIALGASVWAVIMVSLFHFPFHIGRFSHICLFLIGAYISKVNCDKQID